MKKILTEIQNGDFAREWILENKAGAPGFLARRRRDRNLQIEQVGQRLRGLMTWINAKSV
jgi:ketol-acid reductoisomerase